MRRILSLFVIVPLACLPIAGCDNHGTNKPTPRPTATSHPTGPTTPRPTPTRPTRVPQTTAEAMGQALHSPTLGLLGPIVTGKLKVGGLFSTRLTLARQGGVAQFVPTARLQGAADLMGDLPGRNFKTTVTLGKSSRVVAYHVNDREMSKKYMLFLHPATAAMVVRESTGRDPGFGGSTLYEKLGAGDYDVSLVFGRSTDYDIPTMVPDAATYVELCQNLLRISYRFASGRLPVSTLSSEDLGQELWCNSYGMAMSIARAGYPYSVYKRVASTKPLHLNGQDASGHRQAFSLTRVVFGQAEYNNMK